MEAVATQIKEVPSVVVKTPILFLAVGLLFLVITLVIEAYKPGLLTGPVTHLLQAIGLK